MDAAQVNVLGESLISPHTRTLNMLISDATWSTNCCVIGDRMEWKPLAWMLHEKTRIEKLDKLRLVMCESRLANHVKQTIRQMFRDIEIEFHDLLMPGIYPIYLDAQDMAKKYRSVDRVDPMYYSVGTMRLNRFLLVDWLQKNKARNFGHPVLSDKELKVILHPLSRLCKKDFSDYENVNRRFFGDCHVDTYWQKHVDLLLKAKIGIVTEQPLFDYVERFYSEKLIHPIASKTLPFFIGNKNDNENIRELGFQPYIGFDYSAESISNVVERWQAILDANKKFLLDDDHSTQIFQKNSDIIQHNYSVLIETDWKQKAVDEVLRLPQSVRDFLETHFLNKKPPTIASQGH